MSKYSNAIFEARAYIRHVMNARGPHGVHSPLVFELITNVLGSEKYFHCFKEIEIARKKLLSDSTAIDVVDFGAGSRSTQANKRFVKKIASTALQNEHNAQAIFQLVNYFKPKNILELGTSLGITTSYLACANKKTPVYTIEGSPLIAEMARLTINALSVGNVFQFIGSFEEKLMSVIQEMGSVSFALIDGNHRFAPTLSYFQLIADHCDENSIVVLDDIHWSEEMQRAWDEIRSDRRITLSLDFFDFGVLFFGLNREKEHFVLRLPD